MFTMDGGFDRLRIQPVSFKVQLMFNVLHSFQPPMLVYVTFIGKNANYSYVGVNMTLLLNFASSQ